MTAPNRATLWGRTIADELAKAGVTGVCIAPGSRSTPLTVALNAHDDIAVFSHLDERSAAFFALGRGKRTGEPTAVVCTSGTAAANFHPAVVEADTGRVPLLVLTADRPAELRDSGANQTVDQEKLYGSAVRSYRDLPEPAVEPRRVRSLRTTVCRAVAETVGAEPGPVHLNVPVAKPLEPTAAPPGSPDAVPETFAREHPLAANGRDGSFVTVHGGTTTVDDATLDALADAVDTADRGLLVAGPTDDEYADALADLTEATGFPILADPLSNTRYGPHVERTTVLGGYDAYLAPEITEGWPAPDVVLRFGASPTSKPLRTYLARTGARQFVVDPAGAWREAEFRATDLAVSDPEPLARRLAERIGSPSEPWPELEEAEAEHWMLLDERDDVFEGRIARVLAADAPDPATMFVSNSMPVRDFDRFARPSGRELTVLGNRGASGIDGITSTALGAGSATDDPLILLTGDLAYYHDLNGLLALSRCGVDATIALVNNDGGGIFHMLPIEAFDPPFRGQFKTPHGIDFEPTSDLYGFDYARTDSLEDFREHYRASLDSEGTQVVEYASDAEASHRAREALHADLVDRLAE